MAGCRTAAVSNSMNRPFTLGLIASFSRVPAKPNTAPLSAEIAKWLLQKCTNLSPKGRVVAAALCARAST